MVESSGWSRRQFLAGSGAMVAHAAAGSPLLSEEAQRTAAQVEAANVIPPLIVITGGIKPLFEVATVRPLRYTPEGGKFVIRNGGEFFNRPVYGPLSDLRVDAGDRPEFSLYRWGMAGT